MQYNVSQLLKAPIGATQEKIIEQDISWSDDGLELLAPVSGSVRLLRTDAGILVEGTVRAIARVACGRCLADTAVTLEATLEEEYRSSAGLFATEKRSSDEEDDPALTINELHLLDLRDLVRQQLLLAMPIEPRCRPECAGLCPQCGEDLNEGPCGCTEQEDPRWAALQALRIEVEEEEQGVH